MNATIQTMPPAVTLLVNEINQAAQWGDITWNQREELMGTLLKNPNDEATRKLTADLLHAWKVAR